MGWHLCEKQDMSSDNQSFQKTHICRLPHSRVNECLDVNLLSLIFVLVFFSGECVSFGNRPVGCSTLGICHIWLNLFWKIPRLCATKCKFQRSHDLLFEHF